MKLGDKIYVIESDRIIEYTITSIGKKRIAARHPEYKFNGHFPIGCGVFYQKKIFYETVEEAIDKRNRLLEEQIHKLEAKIAMAPEVVREKTTPLIPSGELRV